MTPEENLANAIILQAVKDYRDALRKLKKPRKNQTAEIMKEECERFFCSQWYEALTSVDGKRLMEQLNEEVENE